MSPVTGDQPELSVIDDRSGNLIISVTGVNASPEGNQSLIYFPAVRQPVRHTRCSLIEHKEVELRTEFLVIALHSFLNKIEMRFELCFVRECIDINSLQGITVRVASPVCAGCRFDLERCRHKFLRVGDMRSAAQVDKIFTCVVNRKSLILRKILNQLCLEFLIFEKLESFCTADFFSCPILTTLNDLMHLILDHLIVVLCDRTRKDEVIVHTVSDLRTDCILNIFLAEDFDYSLCQNVGKRVSVNFENFLCHFLSPPCFSSCALAHLSVSAAGGTAPFP